MSDTNALSSYERRKLLHHAEADLSWLLLGGNRYRRAVAILTDSELQAAIVRAQRPEGGRKTEGSTAWSDPTGMAGIAEAACEVRAAAIRRVWINEGEEVADAVSLVLDHAPDTYTGRTPSGPMSTIKAIQWLTIVPHDRVMKTDHLSTKELVETDHAIRWAADHAHALRQGRELKTSGGQRVPSVFGVLEAARAAIRDSVKRSQDEPAPVQQPMQGCVSCRRDGGHFEPIDLKNHSKRSMCRACGDYASGEGSWLPLGAVQYMHRTGKNLTYKIIEDAKRTERAS